MSPFFCVVLFTLWGDRGIAHSSIPRPERIRDAASGLSQSPDLW